MSTMPQLSAMRLELSPSAKDALAAFCDRNGMLRVAVLARIVEWFAGQPEPVQVAVLGQYPKDIEADVAKLILRILSEQGGQKSGGAGKERRGQRTG
jgi:hypothetical protein